MDKKIIDKINLLAQKYSATGQNLDSYLDGLLLSDFLGYWDYINLDTLLTLQKPKTDFPDEKIFIIYHQITELYFKLCINEIEQINENGRIIKDDGQDLGWNRKLSLELFIEKMKRLNRYMKNLIESFDVMIDGMDKREFLKFRMALLPSSGFQSVQFRKIEIRSTEIKNISSGENNGDILSCYDNLYWKKGAIELSTGKKTYTLRQFEKKYDLELRELSRSMVTKNISYKYNQLSENDKENKHLIKLMKEFDYNFNINWKLAHYKSAVKNLKGKKSFIEATGGTNWESYLPPKFQKTIFFPQLFSDEEIKNWGKSWVESIK